MTAHFTNTVLNATFTVSNSVKPGGIHHSPNQTTGGNGAITGIEVQIQVGRSNAGQFYWLSASPKRRRHNSLYANLDPDWLRVGTDIVGGSTPPTFNAAFALNGNVLPEPSTALAVLSGFALLAGVRRILGR